MHYLRVTKSYSLLAQCEEFLTVQTVLSHQVGIGDHKEEVVGEHCHSAIHLFDLKSNNCRTVQFGAQPGPTTLPKLQVFHLRCIIRDTGNIL